MAASLVRDTNPVYGNSIYFPTYFMLRLLSLRNINHRLTFDIVMIFGVYYRILFIYNCVIIELLNVRFALRDLDPVLVNRIFLYY